MIKNIVASCLLMIVMLSTAYSQADFTQQYKNAKALFADKKYNLAMETFKPLVTYDQLNPYSAYASFYYAVSAYNQGYNAVAKDMFNQIKKLNPSWDKLNEVNFWLSKIHFDNRDYFQGLKTLSLIDDKKFNEDIEALKSFHLLKVTDIETLKMMLEDYPKDEIIAKRLANALAKDISDEEHKATLEALIDRFKLERTDYVPEAPESFKKDRYSVALMLPFMINTLEPTPGKKRNQIVLDFYEGMKLALDTLNKDGEFINLRAYDTERNAEKINRILSSNELKNTDLIVGPLFLEENKIVQDFSLENQINVIHPFANNTDVIGENPYSFLYQPSSETLGKKSAEYLAATTRRKNCLVFYGPTKKDSVMAANFVQKANEVGLNIITSKQVNAKEARVIIDILATPTEFDEFKYPIEFTLKKDSIGSVFVASDDALIYTKVVGGVETRGDSIKVVGSENWMDDTAIPLEKYQSLNIVLTAPNFISRSKGNYRIFENRFIKNYGRTPSNIAKIGYEFMMFIGNQLKNNGVYFQEALNEEEFIPGYLSEGFNFQFSRNNQLVPFIAMKNGEMKLIDKR